MWRLIVNFIKKLLHMTTPAQNLATNSSKVAYTSYFPTDQILGTFTGTFTVTNSASGNVVLATNISDTTLFDGVYRVDSGPWTSIGTTASNISITVDCISTVGSITVETQSPGAATNTIDYKIVLIAKSNQANLGTITPALNVGEKAFINTTVNYRKIYSQGTIPVTVGDSPSGAPYTTVSETVSHSLGIVPVIRTFIELSGAIYNINTQLESTPFYAGYGLLLNSFPSVDTSNFYITFNNQSSSSAYTFNLHYRIYGDS